MMRFHTAITGGLATLLVVPVFVGQAEIATLQDALGGTVRALEVLHGLERKLQEEPTAALGLVLAATEPPVGTDETRDQRLETLRDEVNLLQMELDARESPVMGADGAVAPMLGTREPLRPPQAAQTLGITTGIDDSLRALLSEQPASRAPGASAPSRSSEPGMASNAAVAPEVHDGYSADPLRHGIACYRAGRYAEALERLSPLDDGQALYWKARALERLERLDEAVATMERAVARGGEGFEQKRAETDLEFLRWKRDFVATLPGNTAAESTAGPKAGKGGRP